MKLLIWFTAFFAEVLLITILKENGIILGGLPTMALYILTFTAAAAITTRWDWIRFKHKAKKAGKTPVEYAKFQYNTSIIDLCCRYHTDRNELKKRLKVCLEAETLMKKDCNILMMLFKDKVSLAELDLI